MTQRYTEAEIALMKANTAIDEARTLAILTQYKTDPTKAVSLIFDDRIDYERFGREVNICSLVAQVYKVIHLDNKLYTDTDSTVLRGYGCIIREEYNHPWCEEFVGFVAKWKTINDVVKETLAFEGMSRGYMFGCIDNVDSTWLHEYMVSTPYVKHYGLPANRRDYLTKKRKQRKEIAGYGKTR